MNDSFRLLTASLLTLWLFSHALADDTHFIRGAQITTPEKWVSREAKNLTTFTSGSKGAFIEVYSFSKVPESTPEKIRSLVAGRKNTLDVEVTSVKAHEQHGLTGIKALGTARIHSTAVQFELVSLPVSNRAVFAIAFVDAKQSKTHEKDITSILNSIKAPKAQADKPIPAPKK